MLIVMMLNMVMIVILLMMLVDADYCDGWSTFVGSDWLDHHIENNQLLVISLIVHIENN